MGAPEHGQSSRGPRLSREERREHLLDVAAQLVLEVGADAVTMEGVAAAAGVSKGLGYVYFANRAELLLALLGRESQHLETRTATLLAPATTYEERLRATTAAWFDTVEERGTLLAELLQAGQIEGLQEARDAYYRAAQRVHGELAAEELGIPLERAITASAVFIAGLDGVLDRWVRDGRPRAEVEEAYITSVLGALRALTPAPAQSRAL